MRSFIIMLTAMLLPLSLTAGERNFEKKFNATSGGLLTVDTDFGDVIIKGTSSGEVRVEAKLRGNKTDLDEFEITAVETGQGIEVRGRGNKDDDWWSTGFDNLHVKFSIVVPEQYNVRLMTAGGDINIEALDGTIQGETSGGDIILKNLRGEFTVETSGGDIVATELKGNMRGSTSGGDIRVSDLSGNASVETSGGDIRIGGVSGNVVAETSGGDIAVTLTGSNKGVMAETSGGDIDIYTQEGIRANLDASTSGGSVICSLPITLAGEIDESRVRGTINGGGELIRARTSGGDIRIKRSE